MALTDNLISYWKCDEASGNLLDAAGSNTLTDHASTGTGSGIINTGRTFNGSTQYFDVASNASLDVGTSDFSIQVWMNLTSFTGDPYIISKQASGAPYNGYGMFAQDISFKIGFETSDGTYQFDSSTTTVSAGVWTHIIITRSGANLAFYLNGAAAGTSSSARSGSLDTTANFNIGSFAGSQTFNGNLDEIALWKRQLSSGEVTSLYNSGAGLAYPFGGGSSFIASWITA